MHEGVPSMHERTGIYVNFASTGRGVRRTMKITPIRPSVFESIPSVWHRDRTLPTPATRRSGCLRATNQPRNEEKKREKKRVKLKGERKTGERCQQVVACP